MKFKNVISKSFNISSKLINENGNLNSFNWDSVTKINLISYIEDKYDKIIDINKLNKAKTFKDLNNIILKTLEK
tara:strand:- start:1651 stop:1872 length:222 start_codon:yes stop_codon:yes gene_type:complete